MRDLRLPAFYRSTEPLFTGTEHFDEALEIRRLSGRIIAAASAIEQQIAQILMRTIFREVRTHESLVLGSVLNSDWCTFAAKRKLLFLAIKQFNLLQGEHKTLLEKNLKNVTQYRNAFAHGVLTHNVDQQELHYFEGEPRIAILDDSYLERLENDFERTWKILQGIIESFVPQNEKPNSQ